MYMTAASIDWITKLAPVLGLWLFLSIVAVLLYRLCLIWLEDRAKKPADDSDQMLARAQVKLAYMLIAGILLLSLVTIGISYLNDKFSSLATTISTGILTLAGTAAGYFLSRQRPHTSPDPKQAPAAGILTASFTAGVPPNAPTSSPPAAPSGAVAKPPV